MPSLSLSTVQGTGHFVSAGMFGANVVFEQTQGGTPTAAYAAAAGVLGIHNIRFGGGQADLDPARVNAGGSQPVDGVSSINIVDMPGGALRPEVVNYFNWAQAQSQPVQTTLIIPTKHLSAADYGPFGQEIADFVQAVMQQYGHLIAAFQIGNEYWEMGETSYGQKASVAAEAIAQGLSRAGIAPSNQPEILVQMATAGNNGSEFGPGTPGSYGARTEAANQQIIAQLSDSARDAIDGVTEHYYYNSTDLALAENGADLRAIDRDYAIWDAAFSKELSFNITEWNIRTTAHEIQGMVGASTLVHQFENMIRMGVDTAHIWGMDYHSRTALTLDTDAGVRLDGKGRLTNSPTGAIYDLMSEDLVGKELLNASFSSGLPGVDVTAYASDSEAVLYIASRSREVTSFDLDLGDSLPVQGGVSGVQVMLDRASTNGRQWERGSSADSLWVEDTPYYYNEHDADVLLRDLYFQNAQDIALTLNPFEVVALTLQLGSTSAPRAFAPEPAPAPEPVPAPRADWLVLPEDSVRLSGSADVDTLSLDYARAEVELVFDGHGRAEIHGGSLGRTVILDGIERLAFTDGLLALDTFGTAGEAYRLYQASFDRTPDASGLQFWMEHLDSGAVTLEQAAAAFLGSAEFQSAYGRNLSDAAYLDLLYVNVLDRMPDAAGYAFWETQQAAGLSRAEMLVSFSESEENKANVAGQIDDGIWFG